MLFPSLNIFIEELKVWKNSSEAATAPHLAPGSDAPVSQSSVAVAPILGAGVSILIAAAFLLMGIAC
jgi:hypothetical protein